VTGRRRAALFLVLAPLAVLPALAADPVPAEAQPDAVDRAVTKALTFLRRSQDMDGCWKSHGFGQARSAGVTGLAVMAFLSAGHTPTEGEHARAVESGVRWVLSRQGRNGVISTDGEFEMYHHGICTLMLAEVVGMTRGALADEVRHRLGRAVEVILKAQRPGRGAHSGGWRYTVHGSDADMSVTGWQLLALRAAKNVGCDVPAEAIDRAVAYVRRCYDENRGAFAYTVRGYLTVPCTGTGILSFELCGKDLHRCRESLRAGTYILRQPVGLDQQHCFYGLYYCSQALFQLGGSHWEQYRARLHRVLLPNQRADGAWAGSDGEGRRVGTNYTTAMGVLALTVEYRLLPIYQRGEESTDGERKDR
jgi:hypothetical protein